jgi:hypothetical protein
MEAFETAVSGTKSAAQKSSAPNTSRPLLFAVDVKCIECDAGRFCRDRQGLPAFCLYDGLSSKVRNPKDQESVSFGQKRFCKAKGTEVCPDYLGNEAC